jgi:hypothetical protein
MAQVKIYRNKEHNRAKNPPSVANAVQAWTNLDVAGATATEVPKTRDTAAHTAVTFNPPQGNYQTRYEQSLADVVGGGAQAASWVFDWL